MKHGKTVLVCLVASMLVFATCFRVDPALVARLRRTTQALATLDFTAQERMTMKLGDKDMTLESEVYHRADQGTRRRRSGGDKMPSPPAPRHESRQRDRFGGRFPPSGMPSGRNDEGGRFADFISTSPADMRLLCRNYHMALEGDDRIANRTCEKLALRGRRADRPAVEFWLDKETGLPLKRRDLNAAGEPTAEREITQLCVGERGPDDVFQPRHEHDGREREPNATTIDEAAKILPGLVRPTVLPKGFELAAVSAFTRDDRTKIRLTYTDGLAKVVVYESRADSDDRPREQGPRQDDGEDLVAQRRGFRDFTVLSARFGEIRVVVCSSLSEDELRGVLAGMRGNEQ